MVAALAKTLAKTGNEVRVVTPLYRGVREQFPKIRKLDWFMELPLGGKRVQAEVWKTEPEKGLTILFIHQPDYFQRGELYVEGGKDYADNAERFIFFSKAVLHLARYMPSQPEVVHANDWQTGLIPLLMQHQKLQDGWLHIPKSVFTIHNLAYQGVFPASQYELANLPPHYFNPNGVEYYGNLNCLKAGIAYADGITTVSPRYAREITQPEFGCGLDDLLRKRQSALTGILNGVDYEEWNTTANPHLPYAYSIRAMGGKTKDKLALQKELGLPVVEEAPLFGTITRLAEQKGADILLAALEEMLSAEMQFVLLGSGSASYENGYRKLAARYPGKVAVRIGFDQALSQRIEAAADFYLMPSRYEPCGLNQMYSLRYGTVPIVRVTGGLDDSVVDIAEDRAAATGIKFQEYSARALSKAMRKAMVLYRTPKLLSIFRRNAMKADFSWERVVEHYVEVYRRG